LIDVVITPAEIGETANITWRPQTSIYNVTCNFKTVSAEDESDVEISSDSKGNLTVDGQIPLNHQPLVKTYQVEDPARFARSLMIESLKRQEIDINASINTKNPNQNLPESYQYENMERVAILTSPPLRENAKLILKVSHNLHTNTLVPLIAAKNGKKTFEEGLELEKSFIESAGINTTSLSLGGGAGGATSDLISPVAAAKLLRYMNTADYYQTYRDALPILGVDGTLATTVKPDSPARGKVQAKTGTLIDFDYMNNVLILRTKGLAGYMTSSQGKNLVFVIYVNNVRADSMDDVNRVGEDLGRICELIYETY